MCKVKIHLFELSTMLGFNRAIADVLSSQKNNFLFQSFPRRAAGTAVGIFARRGIARFTARRLLTFGWSSCANRASVSATALFKARSSSPPPAPSCLQCAAKDDKRRSQPDTTGQWLRRVLVSCGVGGIAGRNAWKSPCSLPVCDPSGPRIANLVYPSGDADDITAGYHLLDQLANHFHSVMTALHPALQPPYAPPALGSIA